jgi:hypothetical protein
VRQSTRNLQILGSAAQATGATPLAGGVFKLRPVRDDIPDDVQEFTFYANTQFNGGASTPTGQAKVQGSIDGTTWWDIATGAVQAADNVARSEQLTEVSNQRVPKYVRAVTALAGGTAPTLQNVTIGVGSNADYTIDAGP